MFRLHLAVALTIAGAVPAQAIWTQLSPPSSPDPMRDLSMAYDPDRDQVVLYRNGQTWEFQGTTWTQMAPASQPGTPRWDSAMVYDSDRQLVVLFGGSSFRNDTWEWDGVNWREVSTATKPPGRRDHAMAYDSNRKRIILFGGSGLGGRLDDTWEFDGSNWVQRFPTTSPSPRYSPAMVYDSKRKHVVLYGGHVSANSGDATSDTWAWDGNDWTQQSPVDSPPPLLGHQMIYDLNRNRVVLFGGGNGSGLVEGTWEFDGTTWRKRPDAVGPSPRSGHGMAYDSLRQRVLVFGGGDPDLLADTWEYHVNPVASEYEEIGVGCAGSQGTPILAPVSDQLPWVGEPFQLEITSIPQSALNIPFGLIGFSKAYWESFTLPRDLAVHGMPGCTQYVSIDFSFVLSRVGGLATWEIPIPNDPGLVGLAFYTQAFVFDHGVNPLGAVVSNAGEGVIGVR